MLRALAPASLLGASGAHATCHCSFPMSFGCSAVALARSMRRWGLQRASSAARMLRDCAAHNSPSRPPLSQNPSMLEATARSLHSPLAPLDRETVLNSVAKTGRLVVADECSPACSVSSEIAAIVAEEGLSSLKKPVKRVNFADVPVPASPPLERFLTPTVDKVVAAAKSLM